MTKPLLDDAWTALTSLNTSALGDLFNADDGRVARWSRGVSGIHFDLSKTHLDARLGESFAVLALAAGYPAKRDALFAGEIVNGSEGRAATHLAERGQGAAEDNAFAAMCHARMRSLVDAIEGGAFGEIRSILHIGIGGSALGPDLIIDALGRDADRFEVRVLANIDGEAFDEAVSGLDPASTLVIGVSKTFTTIETLTNLGAAIDWLREGGVLRKLPFFEGIERHAVSKSAAPTSKPRVRARTHHLAPLLPLKPDPEPYLEKPTP